MNQNPLLEIKNLKTYFPIKAGVFKTTVGHIRAVDDISLTIYKGETLGIVGESGCGKTTLCKSIVMLNNPVSGEIQYYSNSESFRIPCINKSDMDKARRKIQYIFQDPQSSLNPVFTVFGSMNDVLRLRGVKKKKERRKIVGDLLEAVNMRRDQLDDYPHEFSGGQRQRIGIARALCVNPELVICDEAVSALDVSIQAQVLQLLKKFKEERNLTYIFVTHNLAVVEYVSDRIAVMYLGKVVELADTDDLFKNMFHPYTKALCSAIPVADINAKKNKIVLTGDVPNPANPPSGCPFHPRCLNCFEKCKTDVPKLRKYKVNGKDYFVACHLAHNQLKEKEIQEDLK